MNKPSAHELDKIQAEAFLVYLFVKKGSGSVVTACEAVNALFVSRGLEKVNYL